MTLPVCPYCRVRIDSNQETATICPACATPHHLDCWEENGGCTIFGCSAAPVEEAMVQVSDADLGATRSASSEAGALWGQWSHRRADVGSDSTGVPPPPASPDNPAASQSGTTFAYGFDPAWIRFTHPELQQHPSVSKRLYVLLAVFCGFLGAHNLYANRTSVGIIQLCVSMLSCFLAMPVTWIWALVEAATVDQDGDGYPMQ